MRLIWLIIPCACLKSDAILLRSIVNDRLNSSDNNRTRLFQSAKSENAVDSIPTPETTSPAFVTDELFYHDSDRDRVSENNEAIHPSDNADLATPPPDTEEHNEGANTGMGAATSANSVSLSELRRLLKEAEDIVNAVHERKSMRSRTAATSTAHPSIPLHSVSGPYTSSQHCAITSTE